MKKYFNTLMSKKANEVTVGDSLVIGLGSAAVVYGVTFTVYGVVILIEKIKESAETRRFRTPKNDDVVEEETSGKYPWEED
jgi:hypothetical protein